MENNNINAEEELSGEALTNQLILDLDAELLSDPFFQSSNATSCSENGNFDPNFVFNEGSFDYIFSPLYPSTDDPNISALMEGHQQLNDEEVGEMIECLEKSSAPFFRFENEVQQHENTMPMPPSSDTAPENADQLYNEYFPDTMAQLPELSDPQQSHLQADYDEGMGAFQAPMSSEPTYLNIEGGVGEVYQEPIFYQNCMMPMQLKEMDYQSKAMSLYNQPNSYQQPVYGCPDAQFMGNMPLQAQPLQQNNPFIAGYNSEISLMSDIPTFEEPTFKVGRISAEERKMKIHRYIKKRNERNFSKKIKYACRKTLADSRPRVKGRFAKNGELEEVPRINTGSSDDAAYNEVEAKDEDIFDFDILAHITGVNSFKFNNAVESWI